MLRIQMGAIHRLDSCLQPVLFHAINDALMQFSKHVKHCFPHLEN